MLPGSKSHKNTNGQAKTNIRLVDINLFVKDGSLHCELAYFVTPTKKLRPADPC